MSLNGVRNMSICVHQAVYCHLFVFLSMMSLPRQKEGLMYLVLYVDVFVL